MDTGPVSLQACFTPLALKPNESAYTTEANVHAYIAVYCKYAGILAQDCTQQCSG